MARNLAATLTLVLLLIIAESGQAQSPGRRPPNNSFNNRNPTQQRSAPAPARGSQPNVAPSPSYNPGYGGGYGNAPYGAGAYGPAYGPGYGPAYGPGYGPGYGPRYYPYYDPYTRRLYAVPW